VRATGGSQPHRWPGDCREGDRLDLQRQEALSDQEDHGALKRHCDVGGGAGSPPDTSLGQMSASSRPRRIPPSRVTIPRAAVRLPLPCYLTSCTLACASVLASETPKTSTT
jgi:hypothetical protein